MIVLNSKNLKVPMMFHVLNLLVGISLQLEQWEKLKNLIGDIDEAIEELRG